VLELVEATLPNELDEVRALFRAFVAWFVRADCLCYVTQVMALRCDRARAAVHRPNPERCAEASHQGPSTPRDGHWASRYRQVLPGWPAVTSTPRVRTPYCPYDGVTC
jgi:hypothetical protein